MTSSSALENRLPDAGAGFVWDEVGEERPAPVLRPLVEKVEAVFTTRIGGVSPAPYDELNLSFRVGDTDDNARANRTIASQILGGAPRWSVVRQVHGADVVRAAPPGSPADADALWTEDPGLTVSILAADCVPLLVTGGKRIGLVHAGWRGLVAGVVENAVAAVGGRPEVFAGPAIGPCCYEVGAEVEERFIERFGPSVSTAPGRVDLWEAAGSAARSAGAGSFRAARVCTSCHPALFFSHRRDGGRTGRQALLARLRDG